MIAGWRCSVCAAHVDVAEPLSWRCPNATDGDRHHALELVSNDHELIDRGDANPFLAFREHLAWDAFAETLGMTEVARQALIGELDAKIAAVAGRGFVRTPTARADALSEALGFTARGGIWLKDETGNVGGSHKARHLFTILAHLAALEATKRAPWTKRPELAISSCGNAAVAAATLAAALEWPLRVFVPEWADPTVITILGALGATIEHCPRRDADPPGDPCVHRFREAVARGAIPFSVQGTENAWCLDGGRTIGWEAAREGVNFDRAFVQVGGGALAAGLGAGLRLGGQRAMISAVQTEACAPLQRAWTRLAALGGAAHVGAHWDECMWPWETVGRSAADGILDDETYDWIPVVEAMAATNGGPIVVAEEQIGEAHRLIGAHTRIDASPTGTAALAGLLALDPPIDGDARVLIPITGVRRATIGG